MSVAIICPAFSTRRHDRRPRWAPRSSSKQRGNLGGRCNTPVLWIVDSADRHLIQLFHPGINARFGQSPTICRDPTLVAHPVAGGRAATHIEKPIHLPGAASSPPRSRFALPFKYHAEHRHHVSKPRYRVTNWAEDDAALKRRGSSTVWFTDQAVQAWRAEPRMTPGGQPHHSALATTTALTMRMVFGLPPRQTEGLIGSVIGLFGCDLAVPDHSTLSRRGKTPEVPPPGRTNTGPLHLLVDRTGLKLGGAGEWPIEKPGTSHRRSWRELQPASMPIAARSSPSR